VLKQVSFNKIYIYLISLIIFLIPSNLFFKINYSSAYVNGLLVDYLIPKFYVSDIPILLLLLLWLIKVIKNKQKVITEASNLFFPSILISLIIVRQIFVSYPLASIWYLLQLIEIGFLGWFLTTHKKLLQKTLVHHAILITIWFQSILAIWQFALQKSFLNYSFLGETNLSNSIGLAKDMWWHTGRVLPYSTTAHPNILGGILAIFSLLLIAQQKRNKILTTITVLLAIVIIVITQSISAGVTLFVGLILITKKQINLKSLTIIGALLFVITPILINLTSKKLNQFYSLTRRSYLQNASIDMFLNNPIAGVGLNQFTSEVEKYSDTPEIVRFVQPVHHIGLLWLTETGVLGILFIWSLRKKINIKKIILPLLILLPIAVLDHYLLTQQSGLLLATFFITLEKNSVKVKEMG